MSTLHAPEHVETAVIGGGQAGLSVGYHLARRHLSFVILEGNGRIGDTWRARWDSLRLFTPARFNGLDGMPFPAQAHSFPTKDEMADYLEGYAERFDLPVRTGVRVERLTKRGNCYLIVAADQRIEADNVVVAMGNYQQPRVPSFARQLDPRIVQLHSAEYRNPAQLRKGGVLVVGAGNSGAEIAMELSATHHVWMAGRDTGHIPFRIDGMAARLVLARLALRFLFHRLLTVHTPMGRKARQNVLTQGGPLIRVKPGDLAAAGVERVPRVAGAQDERPVLEDGRVLDTANVIWCTGYEPGFSWIELPVLGEYEPLHQRGVVEGEPGLYFVGLQFLYGMSSGMVHGVGRDAEYIVRHIAEHRTGLSRETPLATATP